MSAAPDRSLLQRLAQRVMTQAGLSPEFPPEALAELPQVAQPPHPDAATRDLRSLLWCSIDNDESRDLDQLTVAAALPSGCVQVLVAIADVDALVPLHSALDTHAQQNTTSVYTTAQVFPMLPERLSTDLTSLNFGVDRLAVVMEMEFDSSGTLQRSEVYRALVHNHARLSYNDVAPWLEGTAPVLPDIAHVPGLAENLQLQDRVAQQLNDARHAAGALDFQTIQARPVFAGEQIQDLKADASNRAKELISEFMIAANTASAAYLTAKHFASIRRIVRTPKRWDRIVSLAAEHHTTLPVTPDPQALESFLQKAKAADPVRFPDLSLSIIKLLGAGEYDVHLPDAADTGHFGLAVKGYAHSTAPNRRYPDLITQRLLKAAIAGQPSPYSNETLAALAKHCSEAEDLANKVERQLNKSAAALFLRSQIGAQFDAIVTGRSEKGTWVRIFHPPVEGRLEQGYQGLDVGHKVRVQLIHTDVERGFIDFKRA